MEQAELAAIRLRAEKVLTRLPGVVGVGFGRKEIDGQVTANPALRVYVMAKKPLASLSSDEVVPIEFEGIPTDVLVVKSGRAHPCEDNEQHRPLVGGIMITNFKKVAPTNSIGVGTLGFFATIDGQSGPDNVVLVSNNHVLMANGAKVGDEIFQPEFATVGSEKVAVTGTGSVAEINNEGKKGYRNYAYRNDPNPPEAAIDFYIDCATAKLDICISSWCKTNCGIAYKNAVRNLNIGGSSKLAGVVRVTQAEAALPSNYEVFKVGRTTARTKGHVTETYGTVDLQGTLVHGVMIVAPLEPDCDSILRFSAGGDSGSAVVNANRMLVGILFGGADDNSEAWVSHIHPVLDLLKVTPISTAHPPLPPAGEARADAIGFFDGGNETVPLRERFLRTPVGRVAYPIVIAHREEVVRLVNHVRPVTLAWHRSKGPDFLAHAIENLREPDHIVPLEIEGVTQSEMLEKMATVLSEYGSQALASTLTDWRHSVLEHASGISSLHDLVAALENEPVDA